MTDTTLPENPQPKPSWRDRIPRLTSRWWTALLAASLGFNLLVGGLALGNRYGGHRMERMSVGSLTQLVPRRFVFDLSRERRRELMADVRQQMKEMRGQENNVALSNAFAAVLEKDAVTEAELKSAVEAFTIGPDSAAGRSGKLALNVLAKLTPAERKSLAAALRERAERQGRRKKQ